MIDYARQHMARIGTESKEPEAIDTMCWPSMSPYINIIEHELSGMPFAEISTTLLQNIVDLRVAIVDESNRFP